MGPDLLDALARGKDKCPKSGWNWAPGLCSPSMCPRYKENQAALLNIYFNSHLQINNRKHYKKTKRGGDAEPFYWAWPEASRGVAVGGDALELLEVLSSAHVTEILNPLIAGGPCSSWAVNKYIPRVWSRVSSNSAGCAWCQLTPRPWRGGSDFSWGKKPIMRHWGLGLSCQAQPGVPATFVPLCQQCWVKALCIPLSYSVLIHFLVFAFHQNSKHSIAAPRTLSYLLILIIYNIK